MNNAKKLREAITAAGAGAHLARTVRAEVEGVEKNPTLAAALEQHELAAALVEALA